MKKTYKKLLIIKLNRLQKEFDNREIEDFEGDNWDKICENVKNTMDIIEQIKLIKQRLEDDKNA